MQSKSFARKKVYICLHNLSQGHQLLVLLGTLIVSKATRTVTLQYPCWSKARLRRVCAVCCFAYNNIRAEEMLCTGHVGIALQPKVKLSQGTSAVHAKKLLGKRKRNQEIAFSFTK